MKAELTASLVRTLQPETKKRVVWDTKIDGFGAKIEPSGTVSFVYVYRFPSGRAGRVRWYSIGKLGKVTVAQAREDAERLQGQVAAKQDPMALKTAERAAAEAKREAPKRSVAAITKEFIERYAKRRNRSWGETERILNRHVVPAWGDWQIYDVTRADVNELLDEIEDESGAPMATAVLAQVRKMFNWHATRDDKFNSPIVRGMGRTSAKKMKRDRILTDDEIRVMWQALEASAPPYRQLVRFLLLTVQRRVECSGTQKVEIGHNSQVWTVPPERYKTDRENLVPLSRFAMHQISDLGELLDLGEFVFTTTGDKPFSGFSKAKARLDAEMERILRERVIAAGGKMPKGKILKPWRLHDLRRTSKTLMQRIGTRPDISERVLGHVIEGVEGTYDRYEYLPEKRQALDALAVEVACILADMNREVPRVLIEVSAAIEAANKKKVVALRAAV